MFRFPALHFHLTTRILLPKSALKTPQFSPNSKFPEFLRRRFNGRYLGVSCSISNPETSSSFCSTNEDFDVELDRLLALLPEEIRRRIREHPELQQLIEVVMDLGRKPLARFPSGDFVIWDYPITVQDIEHATSQVGDFAIDNRAGISRTLHRISAIRNRKGTIIGLTCRVGRAISGSAKLLQDLIQDGASLLLIGPPGVGKTTIIREISRMLANDYKKRVMIVDTSNEIGGDGDIPHAGIGSARRMQVANGDKQHQVLIEAVENHMPQVIVIDEIGTKLEAMAASTIAQRGIQLVATAHGITIENLIMNPSLEMLVGGIESVTLGDEEASRRGIQKTVLERKGPATFTCGVEIISKTELRVHRSLEATVDAILAGRFPNVEVRKMNSLGVDGSVQIELLTHSSISNNDGILLEDSPKMPNSGILHAKVSPKVGKGSRERGPAPFVFVYGIVEATVMQGIKQLSMAESSIQLSYNISEADAVLALQPKLKKNPRIQAAAEFHDLPVYITKTCSLVNVTKAIRALLSDYEDSLKDLKPMDNTKLSEKTDALEEARIAIEQVVIPKGEAVNLLPRPSTILASQMVLVRKYHLQSDVIDNGSGTHLRILPLFCQNDQADTEADEEFDSLDDLADADGQTNGSLYSGIDRLPILSD